MAGLQDLDGNLTTDTWRKPKPIKLATYDIRFVDSVSSSIRNGKGLTDRQVLLAIKIIVKYHRQWTQIGLDPSYLESDDIPLRLPQREVDRTHAAWIEDKKILIKFPYDPKIITKLNSAAAELPGNWTWNTTTKQWSLDLLECNVRELVNMDIIKPSTWQVDADLQSLMEMAAKDDLMSCHPTLDVTDQGLCLANCPEPLLESMQQHGFREDGDLLHASLLAFKHGMVISPELMSRFEPSDPRRMLLQAQVPEDDDHYPGRSNMTWHKLDELMRTANGLNYVFLYRTNTMPLVMSHTKDYHACSKEYIISRSGETIEISKISRQSVLVTDKLIGRQTLPDLAQEYLAVLYMIADDERVDA